MIDARSFAALRDAVQRDLLPDFLRAAEAGFKPRVVGIRRSKNGVIVRLALGSGVHVAREVQLDPLAVDQRLRLGVLEAAISVLVAEAVRRSATARRSPLGNAP